MLVSYKAIQTNFFSFTKSLSKRMRQQERDTVLRVALTLTSTSYCLIVVLTLLVEW